MYDLCLLSCHMSEISSYDRDQWPRMPKIFVSGPEKHLPASNGEQYIFT